MPFARSTPRSEASTSSSTRRSLLVISAIALLLASSLAAQDTQASVDDPAARAILEAAAKTQTPGGTKPITSYAGTYEVTVFEDEQGKPATPRSGRIEQTWQLKGKRTRYRRVFHNTVKKEAPAHYVSNGSSFMYLVEGQPPRDMRRDPNLKQDLENLKEEIRRTGELMKLFFLGNLDDEITVTMGKKDGTVPHPKKPRKVIPVDEVIIKRKDGSRVLLRIGDEDRYVYEAEILPESPKAAVERFAFGYHKSYEDPEIGQVVIPMRVTYKKGDRTVMRGNVPSDRRPRFNLALDRNAFRAR